MILRLILMACALGALAACQPAIPDSGAPEYGRGVGFDNPFDAQRKRDAELAAATATLDVAPTVNEAALPNGQAAGAVNPAQVALNTPPPNTIPRTQSQLNDAENAAAVAANSGRPVLNASPSNPAPQAIDNPGLSDENDFDAVAGRQTIASDKARIEANRARYQIDQPTALPSRTGETQPNVVAYALETTHPVGTQVYRRISLISASRSARNCAAFASADEAQIAFLARGGPVRDRKGLDPDGDGYACGWNPARYRTAVGG